MLNKNSGFLNKSESQILVFDVIAHKWHSQGIYSIVLLENNTFCTVSTDRKINTFNFFYNFEGNMEIKHLWKFNCLGGSIETLYKSNCENNIIFFVE